MTLGLKRIGCATAAFALALALAPLDGARADTVTYTYTGLDFTHANQPFTTLENVTGTITFNAPLAANLTLNPGSNVSNVTPASFSFTAGPETLTSDNFNPSPTFTQFQFSTDAQGNITGWIIDIGLGGNGNFTIWNDAAAGELGDQAFVGAFFSGPKDPSNPSGGNHTAGQFTLAAAVPEPSTWAMMILGFVGLGFMGFRRKTSFRAA
jgi:PEP-CTERM motif